MAIVRSLGQDCTEEFAYTHSLTAWKQLADFQIGVVSACAQPRCALCSKLPPTQVEVFEIPCAACEEGRRDHLRRRSGGTK